MHFRELTDRYSLDKILRSTRTGTVLRATDSRSGQAVAIKQINVSSPAELVQRTPHFEKLTAALETLRHPNLPLLIDSGFTTEGTAFLVMELLEGRTLDAVPGPPRRLLALLYQALAGLEALARRGLAHHNLSPDNLLVVNGSQPERIKLLGLGTPLFRGAGPGASETARYRAPELDQPVRTEQAEPGDGRSDLFSFAATACQVLGATIGLGDSPVVQLPFALTLELESSEALRQVLERALRRIPAERPTHQEIRDGFHMALGAADVPAPAEERPAGPRLVIPGPAPATAAAATPAIPVIPAATVPTFAPPAAPAATPLADLDGTGGELLPSIDDELLNSLAPPPPSAPAAVTRPPARAGGGSGGGAGSSGAVVPIRRPGGAVSASVAEPAPRWSARHSILLASLALALVLAAGIGYWWFSRGANPAPPVEAAVTPPPAPTRRPAAEVLADAQLAFADGRNDRALEILGTLTAADQSSLPPQGCRALQSLHQSLMLSALENLPDDLAKGLKGDLGKLRFAVAAAGGQEARLPEAARADLARARGLVDLYGQAAAAAGRKANVEVLERFAALTEQLPNATDPLELRDHAAATLEDEAETLARDAKYQEAANHLAPVQRAWPNRLGLKARIEGYQKAQQDELEQAALLADMPGIERHHRPDEALDKIRGITPTPHLAAQFAEIRKRLEDELAQIDQKAPEVTLRDGYLLDYDRGRVVQLSFRVTDDYKVHSVKLMARPPGGKIRELPLQASRLGYTAEIPASFHENGTVDFYVVATDVSGHEGHFGTPDHPQQLKRREGFQRILR